MSPPIQQSVFVENNSLSWFVSGLVDAEGSFGVNIIKKESSQIGYSILIYFEIALNKKDKDLLETIKQVLGVPHKDLYYNKNDGTLKLKISNLIELVNNVIPHFKKYSLFTQKRTDFELLCKVLEIVQEKRHLTKEGLNEILGIKATMNLGLSDTLKNEFLNIEPLTRSIINTGIPNKDWLAGFMEGESCFYVSVYNSPKSKLNYAVQLVFKITQHIRDKVLLDNISKLLECGRVETRKSGDACDFAVTSFKEINKYMIPFWENYPLIGNKSNDYKDFLRVHEIISNKGHLTEEGLVNIVKIKNTMNTKR